MKNTVFAKKELKNLIKKEIKNSFDAASSPSLIPNILNKLIELTNGKLQEDAGCKFTEFLALACGFFYLEVLEERYKKQNLDYTLPLVELNKCIVKDYFSYTEEALAETINQYGIAYKKIEHSTKLEHRTLAEWLKYAEEKNAQIHKYYRNEGSRAEAAKLIEKTFGHMTLPQAETQAQAKIWQDIHNKRKFIKIADEFRERIILAYYGLERKNKSGKTLNVDALTEKLGFRRGEENNALQFCLDNNIGAYVKAQHNGAKVKEEQSGVPNFSTVQARIEGGYVSITYPHAYEGYVRLQKEHFNDIFQGKRKIDPHGVKEHLGEKGIYLQLPLYDYVLGKSLFFKGEPEFSWEDLFFMEEEVFPFYEGNRFDWANFYSEKNAKIIEIILDSDSISIAELSKRFFSRAAALLSSPSKPSSSTIADSAQILKFFQSLFEKWKDEIANGKRVLDPFKETLCDPSDQNRAITEATFLKPEWAIQTLLGEGFFPKELKRLPRLIAENIYSEINPNYYESYGYEYGKGDSQSLIKIIQSKENYEDRTPRYLSYEKLKKRWKDKAENEISSLCFENKLTAYLPVSEKDVSSSLSNDHLSICRQKNCGNPSYSKRYKGLEKLILKEIPVNRGRDLEALWTSSIKIKSDITLNINLQSTDIETKFHIQRVLVSSTFSRKKDESTNEIKKEDLVFLVTEVENIERDWMLNFKQDDSLPVSIISKDAADEKEPAALQENKIVVLNNLANQLKNIHSTKESKGKMLTTYDALTAILQAIKLIDPDFDPMNMPGNVSDFHAFCLSISYGKTIFPLLDQNSDVTSKANTFRAYCKGKVGKNKKPALCAWSSKPRSKKEYWDSLKANP